MSADNAASRLGDQRIWSTLQELMSCPCRFSSLLDAEIFSDFSRNLFQVSLLDSRENCVPANKLCWTNKQGARQGCSWGNCKTLVLSFPPCSRLPISFPWGDSVLSLHVRWFVPGRVLLTLVFHDPFFFLLFFLLLTVLLLLLFICLPLFLFFLLFLQCPCSSLFFIHSPSSTSLFHFTLLCFLQNLTHFL